MPKTGSFTIKATGKCDPKASKSITVAVKTITTAPNPQFPKEKFIAELHNAMREFGITDKNDQIGFLANVEHETKRLTELVENPNFSLKRWRELQNRLSGVKNWLNKQGANAEKEFAKLSPKDKLNIMYSKHPTLGNNQPNDGWDFRGRGAIHLTGRYNYQQFANYVKRPDIMTNPDLVATDMKLAAQAGAFYWKKLRPNASKFAIQGNFSEARKLVNDGIGLKETLSLVTQYQNNKGQIPFLK